MEHQSPFAALAAGLTCMPLNLATPAPKTVTQGLTVMRSAHREEICGVGVGPRLASFRFGGGLNRLNDIGVTVDHEETSDFVQ